MNLPVLCYHNICPLPLNARIKNHFIEPSVFESQIRFLADNGFRSIKTHEISSILSCKKKRFRPVIITFDDGYEDNYHNAFPILKKYGFSAVFFIAVDQIGKKCNWKKRSDDYNGSIVTTAQILEMSESGMELHSHSCSHCFLTDISRDRLSSELSRSREILEKITGKPCNTLSFPAGKYNDDVIDELKKNDYTAAFTTEFGINNIHSNIFSLKRIEVKRKDLALIRFKKRLFSF